MRQLLLLRHAKAEAARADLPDAQRPLSARGRADALEAAQCIAHAGLPIDALLSSPAVRARDTALILATALDIVSLVRFEPAMYPGTPEALLALLQRCDPQTRSVLMVGLQPRHQRAGATACQRWAGTGTANRGIVPPAIRAEPRGVMSNSSRPRAVPCCAEHSPALVLRSARSEGNIRPDGAR